MTRQEKAIEVRRSGANCCQSVLMAFTDIMGMDDELIMKIGGSCGGGFSTAKGTCGALVGAQIVLGVKEYAGKKLSPRTAQLFREFERLCGATVCGDLKSGVGGKKCSCDECIINAVTALEEMINEK